MPPVNPDPKEDEALFEETDPFVDGPISVDHGLNFKVGKGTFLNFNLLVLDTCLITIGENVLFGPNVSIYGATHPLDPAVRRGLKGPEGGKEVHIEDDVWIAGSVIILAGVRIGKGSTVGAGAVVTKVSSRNFGGKCLIDRCRMFLPSILLPGIRRRLFGRSRRAWRNNEALSLSFAALPVLIIYRIHELCNTNIGGMIHEVVMSTSIFSIEHGV